MKNIRFYIVMIMTAVIALLFTGLNTANAQNPVENTAPPVDVLPAAVAEKDAQITYDNTAHTHPALKLTPDKSELLRLDAPAGSIIVGNPAHLNVLADNSQTLVLVPRIPGATHFTVLGKDGNILMQRHVIVGSPKEKYLRVRRSCAGQDEGDCQTTSVFYCPDMCHEIALSGGSDGESDESGSLEEALSDALTESIQNSEPVVLDGGPTAE